MKKLLLCAGFLTCVGLGQAVSQEKGKDNVPPDGFTALFNGKDLSNWQGLITLPQRMKLTDKEALAKAQKAADEKMVQHWR